MSRVTPGPATVEIVQYFCSGKASVRLVYFDPEVQTPPIVDILHIRSILYTSEGFYPVLSCKSLLKIPIFLPICLGGKIVHSEMKRWEIEKRAQPGFEPGASCNLARDLNAQSRNHTTRPLSRCRLSKRFNLCSKQKLGICSSAGWAHAGVKLSINSLRKMIYIEAQWVWEVGHDSSA